MKLVYSLGILLVFLASASFASAVEYPKRVIRAATANPPGSMHVATIEKFKEIIENKSRGAIQVQVFYSGSMGDEQTNVQQLSKGQIHLAIMACSNLSPFAPRVELLMLPYLFSSMEQAKKVFSNQSFMQKVEDGIAAQSNTRPLGWLIGGFRHITNSKRPITTLQDIQGMKIRVPDTDVQLVVFKHWGADAYPVAWGETYSNLQQGVAEGQANPNAIHRDRKFWEVQKYLTASRYMLWLGPLLTSETWFQSLDVETQNLVRQAAREATHYEWDWIATQDPLALQECVRQGMIFSKLKDEAAWEKAALSLWPRYYDNIGGKALLDELLQIGNQ